MPGSTRVFQRKILGDMIERLIALIVRFPWMTTYALPHLHRGVALIHLNRNNEALKAFDQALTLQPEYPEVFYYQGMTHLKLERFDEAITAFNQALALNDQYSEVYHHKGIALVHIENYR